MSTVVRPSGPLPRRVYWVRRLLLLLVVVALVWAVTRLLGGGESDEQAGGDPSPAAQDVEETPTATATPDDEPLPSKRERLQEKREQERERIRQVRQERQERREASRVRTVNAVLPSPEGACDLTQVSVQPSVEAGQQAGGAVDLRLAVSTVQPMPCTLDLDADRLLVSITAGDEPVWTSTRCRGAIPQQRVVLRPFWTTTVAMSWSGQRTGGRCSPGADFAGPGSYDLQAAVLTGEPAGTEFTLLEPPPPEPEKPRGGADPEADGAEPEPEPAGNADDGDTGDETDGAPPGGTPPQGGQPDSQTGGAPEPGDEQLSGND